MTSSSSSIPLKPIDTDGDDRWNSQHKRLLSETKEKEPDVVFIGDQIIHELELRPIWNELFEPLHSLNLGIPQDTTENVLFRIHDGILDNINPKIIVVHVGTCNIKHSASEVAEGIMEVVNEIHHRHPKAYVIIVELLPRGQFPNKLREKNEHTNEIIRQKLSSTPLVEIVPAGKTILQADGSISHHDMSDYCILTETGCRKVFEPVYELILQLFENL